MKHVSWVFAAFLTVSAWGQITKDEIYEMTDKSLDEATIVSIVERNCVDFELDGQIIVELTTRISQEVLRTVVDCIQERTEIAKAAKATAAAVSTVGTVAAAADAPAPHTTVSKDAFELPSYIAIELSSNKSSYLATELELRIVSTRAGKADPVEVSYRYSGESDTETEVRCYKKDGPSTLVPGEYVAYLHVVSKRSSFMGKKSYRSDLHKFRAEYKGPGPIQLKYTSREEKTFRASKDLSVEAHGPLLLFGEEHLSVDGQKSLEDLLATTGN